MKKFGKLLKKYGFFAATGTICIGALVAIFMMPNHDGDVSKEPNAYAKNLTADSQGITEGDGITILDEDDLDTTDQMTKNEGNNVLSDQTDDLAKNNTLTTAENNTDKDKKDETKDTKVAAADQKDETKDTKTATTDKKDETRDAKAATTDKKDKTNDVKSEATTKAKVETSKDTKTVAEEKTVTDQVATATDQVEPETFESTTVSTEEPFFADGDTFAWPVEGKVVVPYTDESTKHWFSEALNQTMRTFGICISANEGTEVKAVAKGTVVAADEDSTKLVSENMPNVGSLMVIDHGNGYMSYYGFQNGTMNMDLVGQVVSAGDVLGTVGSPKGAFTSLGDNLYLQVVHNGEVVNPLNYLADQTAKVDGVDLGFAES